MEPLGIAIVSIIQVVLSMWLSARMDGMSEVVRNTAGVIVIMTPAIVMSFLGIYLRLQSLTQAAMVTSLLVVGSIATATGKLARHYFDGEEMHWMKEK